ncbi:DUF2778 domain-containing protein [Ancylobacter pratisalsi]|uniref:DUF2778 domain-containing protein n=1 Tax=Ancylobacter pratisalsi TaxID=1745854 RepID=A0A6P1YN17_9HYPH|nr:DUF2778 domain-containing protein [Ancylobacter pratisalsi]QIB33623.1 DUF2778 domain-containing protein [Ancylobacter pratisalsi]
MRLVGTFLVGSFSFVAMAIAAAWLSSTSLPTPADAARVDPELRLAPAAPAVTAKVKDAPALRPVYTVTDIRNFYSSGELPQPEGWLFDPAIIPTRPAIVASVPVPPPVTEPTVETVSAVPLPMAKPMFAGRVMPGDEPEDTLTLAPSPPKKAKAVDLAMLPPPLPEDEAPDEPPAPPAATKPEAENELRLPSSGDRFAVYDIRARKLYLPSGRKLEAHSGYGERFDDPRHVSVKMLGPTPPNRYKLTMREALFHGVEAVRMTPIGDGKMYGRNGFLVHSYLLGPRGDSNGCISVADYDAFLAAFKKGEVNELIVVEQMPKGSQPLNPLLSWLTGKKS